MKAFHRFSAALLLALVPGLVIRAETTLPIDPAPPPFSSRSAEGMAAEKAAAAIAGFSLSNIKLNVKLSNAREAGVSEVTAEAFQAELSRRLAERMAENPGTTGVNGPVDAATKGGTVEVRFDNMRVQGDVVRGKLGEPLPHDLFAATVRVLDANGQEVSVYIIPETQIRGDKLNFDRNRLLGVEGAAIVYRKLFGNF